MSTFPRQKVSSAEKKAVDEVTGKSWEQKCVDFLIDENVYASDREEILSQYRLVDGGELEDKDYNYVLNPLNTSIDNYKRFGAKLRNYDIITPVINLYTGEFTKRFKNFNVIQTNSEDDNQYKQGLNNLLRGYYQQQTVNKLNDLGVYTGVESQEQEPVQNVVDNYNRTFDKNRVITGQEILEYIHYDQDLDDKYQDCYGDWLRCGIAATYKGIHNEDIDVERVPPWELTIPTNLRSNFLEDAPWIVRRQVMTGNQIIDRWHSQLTEEDIDWLEEKENQSLMGASGFIKLPTQWIAKGDDASKYSIMREINGHEVCHVQWRSYRKVGILTYINEIGQVTTREIDDTYKLDTTIGDISIEWEWISEVREGTRIGDVERYIYVDMGPLPYNRMELNNSSAQKLSYNGRVNRNISGKPISLVTAGRPYQIIYNIIKYQFERIINKNKDKIVVMPQGLIPTGRGGWDEEKHMYYATAQSYMVIDETQPTAGLALQGIKVLDLSLGQYAKEAIEMMQAIKAEWWESIGMNRQRYGDSMASDGKSVTEQAIFRSAIISEELNRKFEKFQEKDYEGILDISKLAFINGKKAKYINSEGREAFLKLNPDDAIRRLETDYGVHVVNSSQETENIQMAKEYGFSLGQNGDASAMLELIGSRNFEKTKEIVTKIDALNKQREEASQQAALESNERVQQMKSESEQAKNDTTIYTADRDYDKTIDAKLLEISNRPVEKEEKDTSKMDNHKIKIDYEELNLAKQELQQKKKEGNQKIAESKAKVKNLNKPVKS